MKEHRFLGKTPKHPVGSDGELSPDMKVQQTSSGRLWVKKAGEHPKKRSPGHRPDSTAPVRGHAPTGKLVGHPHSDRRRRVSAKGVVKDRNTIKYYGKTTRVFLEYLEREEAGIDGREAKLFDRDGRDLDREAFRERVAGDERHVRLVLAPDDGMRLDMQQFTIEFMERVERDLGTRLEWGAVIHEAQQEGRGPNRHAHVVVRGVDEDGQLLRIAPEYLNNGLRMRAEELATERLGFMTDRELAQHRERCPRAWAAREVQHERQHRAEERTPEDRQRSEPEREPEYDRRRPNLERTR